MPLFLSKTKIIIPFDTMYLLRLKKIDIPFFLLIGHYNPFFPKTKFLLLLLLHVSFSAPDRLVLSIPVPRDTIPLPLSQDQHFTRVQSGPF